MEIEFEGVQKTLLTPLWSRAELSKESNPVITDLKAIDIVGTIKYDFNKTQKNIPYFVKLMLAVRAKAIDEEIKKYTSIHPKALIVNLGAGLDTAFYRVDNGLIHWFDIDLPDVITTRKRFIPETDRSRNIAGSIFDMTWIREIPQSKDGVLLISGGVLSYFKEKTIREFLTNLADSIPECDMVFDIQSKFGNIFSNIGTKLKGMKSATLYWGITNAAKIEKWNKNITLIEQYPLFSRTKKDQYRSNEVKQITDLMDKFRMINIVHLNVRNNLLKNRTSLADT